MRAAAGISLVLLAALAPAAHAQDVTMAEHALAWLMGDYRAPLICEIDGNHHRVLRRVRVSPIRRADLNKPAMRISFFDLEAPPGTRCENELGEPEANWIGHLAVTLRASQRVDIAQHEFEAALRRDGGFRYRVPAGRLRTGLPGDPIEGYVERPFADGAADVRIIKRGTDAYRRLLDFGDRRKLRLVLEPPEGEPLTFDLVQFGLR